MTQVSKYPISNKVYERILEILLKSLVEIKNKDESKQFIDDLLTPTEQIMITKRLAIAFLLEKGYEFRTIAEILRVSFGTVARVNFAKRYGSQGYQKMIKKLLREESINDFFLKVGEILTGMVGKGGKGSDTWRYLHQEIKKKRREKPF